jgi:hypothetical protein
MVTAPAILRDEVFAVTIVRVGSNQNYATGWDKAFGKGGAKSASGAATKGKQVAGASAKKKAAKPAKKAAKKKK